MKTFRLQLHGATEEQTHEGLQSVVAHDASGSFAVLAGHERLLTRLTSGIVRLQYADGSRAYAAVMGGLLYFAENQMHIVTRELHLAASDEVLEESLEAEWQAQEAELTELRAQIRRLDRAILTAMAGLGRAKA
ncbi:MAG TPA: hypothetical protein VN515_04805 [Terriglobales bacterium]|nr:hypothetical protein [Terriglobales bacterium]